MSISDPRADKSLESILSTDDESDDEETSILVVLLEDNPLVCSRCYRRTHEGARYTDEFRQKRPVASMDRETLPEIETERPTSYDLTAIEDFDPPSDQTRANPGARSVCECGNIDDAGHGKTRSIEELSRVAQRVSDRLLELDVEHDRDLLVALVREQKSRPDLAGREREILDRAINHSI